MGPPYEDEKFVADVARQLSNTSANVSLEWVRQCMRFVSSRGKLADSVAVAADQVMERLLFADLRDACGPEPGSTVASGASDAVPPGRLPADLQARGGVLRGPCLLQVDELLDVNEGGAAGRSAAATAGAGSNGAPAQEQARTRNPNHPGRLLKMFVTDGRTDAVALELEYIPQMVLPTPGAGGGGAPGGGVPKLAAGCKLLVEGCAVHLGALLLTRAAPCRVTVLGGGVDRLAEMQRRREAAEPPDAARVEPKPSAMPPVAPERAETLKQQQLQLPAVERISADQESSRSRVPAQQPAAVDAGESGMQWRRETRAAPVPVAVRGAVGEEEEDEAAAGMEMEEEEAALQFADEDEGGDEDEEAAAADAGLWGWGDDAAPAPAPAPAAPPPGSAFKVSLPPATIPAGLPAAGAEALLQIEEAHSYDYRGETLPAAHEVADEAEEPWPEEPPYVDLCELSKSSGAAGNPQGPGAASDTELYVLSAGDEMEEDNEPEHEQQQHERGLGAEQKLDAEGMSGLRTAKEGRKEEALVKVKAEAGPSGALPRDPSTLLHPTDSTVKVEAVAVKSEPCLTPQMCDHAKRLAHVLQRGGDALALNSIRGLLGRWGEEAEAAEIGAAGTLVPATEIAVRCLVHGSVSGIKKFKVPEDEGAPAYHVRVTFDDGDTSEAEGEVLAVTSSLCEQHLGMLATVYAELAAGRGSPEDVAVVLGEERAGGLTKAERKQMKSHFCMRFASLSGLFLAEARGQAEGGPLVTLLRRLDTAPGAPEATVQSGRCSARGVCADLLLSTMVQRGWA